MRVSPEDHGLAPSTRAGLDSTAAASNNAEPYLPTPRRHWATLCIAAGMTVTILDASMVIVMLPLIADTYSVEPSLAIWVMTAYQLTMTCLLLQAAAVSERFGHWKVFCAGLGLFAVASLFCAFSTSLSMLIAGRVLQGIGASAVHGIYMALTRLSYPRELFGRAAGVNASVVGLSMAAGPSVGALVLAVADWRDVFVVGAPVALAALAVGLAALPRFAQRIDMRLDLISGGILALAMVCFFQTLAQVREGTSLPLLGAGILAFVILFAILVRRQSGLSYPMFPVDLLAMRPIAFSLAATICAFAAQGLTLVSLPFHLRNITDLSPAMVGLMITPWPVGVAITAMVGGRLSDRCSPRVLCTLALALLLSGLFALYLMPENAAPGEIVWRMFVCGLGFGLFNTPNNRMVILNTPMTRTTAGGALIATCRMTGQALGAALASIAFSHWQTGGGPAALGCAMVLAFTAMAFCALRQTT